MPRPKTTQETPRSILSVPHDVLQDYLTPRREDFLIKKQSEKKGEFTQINSDEFAKMFLHFYKTHPGHVIEYAFLREFFDLPKNPFTNATAKVKKGFGAMGKTLHNVRKVGYCLATPQQHRVEALKAYIRGNMHTISAFRITRMPEFTEPYHELDSIENNPEMMAYDKRERS